MSKTFIVDGHRNVFGVEDDAMLVVITIRRILEEEGVAIKIYRYYAKIFSGRMVDSSLVTHILFA